MHHVVRTSSTNYLPSTTTNTRPLKDPHPGGSARRSRGAGQSLNVIPASSSHSQPCTSELRAKDLLLAIM